MKIDWFKCFPLIPSEVLDILKQHIMLGFEYEGSKEFVVNDSKFYKKVKGKLKPAVVNQAEYLSKGFQRNLEALGWETDSSLNKQEVDGYIELPIKETHTFSFDKESYQNYLATLDPSENDFIERVNNSYHLFFKRKIFSLPKWIKSKFLRPQAVEGRMVKVAMEFETGNIASSFRAIGKLNVLFEAGLIDFGVFVTALDKGVSARIWPSSNRNGSIEELSARLFELQLRFPALIVGFSPDRWDQSADFLFKNGHRCSLGKSKIVKVSNTNYLYFPKYSVYRLADD